jgi:hypothetical protein
MPRAQYSLKTLLWLMAVVAAFLGGIKFEHERYRRELERWGQEFDDLWNAERAKSGLPPLPTPIGTAVRAGREEVKIGTVRGENDYAAIFATTRRTRISGSADV